MGKRETKSQRWVRVTDELVNENKYVITGLVPLNEYEFRVHAENSIGVSLPSLPSPAAIAEDPVKPPTHPLNIEVTDISEKTITIKWGPPRHSYGTPIIGYIVETQKVNTDTWKLWCTQENCKDTEF